MQTRYVLPILWFGLWMVVSLDQPARADDEPTLEGSCAQSLGDGKWSATPGCLEELKKEKKNLFTYYRQAPHMENGKLVGYRLLKRSQASGKKGSGKS